MYLSFPLMERPSSSLTHNVAVNKMHETRDGPGLVLDWHQGSGALVRIGSCL
jgi:hypothetical protein